MSSVFEITVEREVGSDEQRVRNLASNSRLAS